MDKSSQKMPESSMWSPDAAEKARKQMYFIFVGGKKPTKRSLSGALRKWNNEASPERDVAFDFSHRITGSVEDIVRVLKASNVSDKQINDAVKNLVTRKNYEDSALYSDEIKRYEAENRKKKTEEQEITWEQLSWFSNNIHSAVVQGKSGPREKGLVESRISKRGDISPALLIYKRLKQGDVLDVSNFSESEKDYGIVQIKKLDAANSGKIMSKNGVRIATDNLASYKRAIALIFGEKSCTTKYQTAISQVEEEFQTKKPKAKKPAAAKPAAAKPAAAKKAAAKPPQRDAPAPKKNQRKKNIQTIGGEKFST